jgi:hypothetical protein
VDPWWARCVAYARVRACACVRCACVRAQYVCSVFQVAHAHVRACACVRARAFSISAYACVHVGYRV